jgi:RND family efflux transporter MFP subunit
MSVRSETDLSQLRIDRDSAPRRRWLPWAALGVVVAAGIAVYPSARALLDERRAPEVEVARTAQVIPTSGGGSAHLPVLVATGYVIARKSSDVGVKVGGRIQTLDFEEGTRVRVGQIMARLEHADLDAQLAAAAASVAAAETQLAQTIATRDEDLRQLERQRALARDGITTNQALTGAEATAQVSVSRVRSTEASIVSARARVRVIEESIENTNVRAPFDGVVIKKRAEVGETVSPFGVAGQSTREGGAIATIADLRELEVQTEVSENSLARLERGMPATVKLQAYQARSFSGRLREIFPSADRAKAIVEVRVSILDPDADVKPEMTASVTFEEPSALQHAQGRPQQDRRVAGAGQGGAKSPGKAIAISGAEPAAQAPIVLVPKRAVTERNGQPAVWVVSNGRASRRTVALGPDRIDQVEIRSGLSPGEAVVLNPPPDLADGGRVRVKGS